MSPLSTTLRPGRGGPSTSSGVTTRSSSSVIDSPRLQQPSRRPVGHAERVGRVDVEAPGPRVLDQREAERLHAVRDREGDEVVVASLEHVAGLQLDELERVGQLPEDPPQRPEQLLQARAARRSSAAGRDRGARRS